MSKESEQRAQRVRRALAKHGPDLLARVEGGTPIRTALAALQLPPDLEDDLAARPDVRAALARREETLRGQLANESKAVASAALIELEVIHGWRKPGTTTVQDRFGAVLTRYRDWCASNGHAAVFNVLHDMLHEKKETVAERNRKRRFNS